MAEISLEKDLDIQGKYLVEGFPGAGLVGKIAAEHLIEELELEYLGFVDSRELPDMAMFRNEEYEVQPAVRLYTKKDSDLVVLNSDIPVSADAKKFLDKLHDWICDNELIPIYQSGLPMEREDSPSIFGISSGNAVELLEDCGITAPPTLGFISGPTGAMLHRARNDNKESVGLIVESETWLPDPEAADVLINKGISPITGIEVNTTELLESADEIRKQKEQFAERLKEVEEHKTNEAFPNEMYR